MSVKYGREKMVYLILAWLVCGFPDLSGADLVANGGFEKVLSGRAIGWEPLWTREQNVGSISLDGDVRHSGKRSARIEHRGDLDWSFGSEKRIDVTPGDLFVLQAWVKLKGQGSATICVTTRDKAGQVIQWVEGGRTAYGTRDWTLLRSRFVVPRNTNSLHPRIIGSGPAVVWVDDFSLVREGSVADLRKKGLPKRLFVGNKSLTVTLDTRDAALRVKDRRSGFEWRQMPLSEDGVLLDAKAKDALTMTWWHLPTDIQVKAVLEMDGEIPEFTLALSAEGGLDAPLAFPHPFVGNAGSSLVVPMNEGICYPADDDIPPMRLIAYGGHGLSMGFWGVKDKGRGHMALFETPDDAALRITRLEGRLCAAPEWDSQMGRFGYDRRLRYVFFDKGGHVAMCKRYRAFAEERGLLKTLERKRKDNQHVDLLVGAVNVWYWERDVLAIVKEMRSLGIERILWSHRSPPPVIESLNAMDTVLTSRYDIYQDLMDPKVVKEKLWGLHPDWTQGGWPGDLMRDHAGDWRKGWPVKGKDGKFYRCGVLCDRQALNYARERVPKELETHPYQCRFIDTTTASPWRECYDPDHPMTRSESRRWKMALLRYMSEEMNLVTGSETGHEAAVPHVHYFEGMLSLGPYRVPGAGRRMMDIVEEVPDRVAKFQLGHAYRLPLWELVFHDCVVSQWYWGDYNNKLPKLWDKRDLFNILYGTPPMFMFDREFWNKNKDRFVKSYKNVCPLVREVGYQEMTDHRFLTADKSVQQTTFANGIEVVVNFGSETFRLPDGSLVAPMGFWINE